MTRVLILGGTMFAGREIAIAAIEAGAQETTFNRGQSGEDVDGVTAVRGDRNEPSDLARLTAARFRVTHQRDCVQHIYACPPKTAGGCAGVGRRGDKVDDYITEAVLAKLEERTAVPLDDEAPPGMTRDESSDRPFFSTARAIESRLGVPETSLRPRGARGRYRAAGWART